MLIHVSMVLERIEIRWNERRKIHCENCDYLRPVFGPKKPVVARELRNDGYLPILPIRHIKGGAEELLRVSQEMEL